jgi:hypothetical protein
MTMDARHSKRGMGLVLGLLLAGAAHGAMAAEPEYAAHGLAGATPTRVYLRYVEVLRGADAVEDIMPFSPFPAAQNQRDLAAMPPEQRRQALAFIKGLAPDALEVLGETVDGDQASVAVRGQFPGMLSGQPETSWGEITLVRRAGEWKVSNQAFRDTEESASAD